MRPPPDAEWIRIPASGPIDPASVALLLPEPSPGRTIVLGPIAGETSLFSRLLGRQVRIPRAVRGSALLLRGYRNIAGGIVDGADACWGEG